MAKYGFVGRSERPQLTWASFTMGPTPSAIGALGNGDVVKVGVVALGGRREYFWATITGRNGNRFSAKVTNDLALTKLHGLDDESPVSFYSENILQIYTG